MKAGETVVVDGQYKLQEGSKVAVSNRSGDHKGAEQPHQDGDGSQHRGKLGNRDEKPAASPSPAVAASR